MAKDKDYKPADLTRLKTEPLAGRPSLVGIEQAAGLTEPGATASELVDSMPDILAARNFRELVETITAARRGDRQFVTALGAHVIKCGLSPLIIDLIKIGILPLILLQTIVALLPFHLLPQMLAPILIY